MSAVKLAFALVLTLSALMAQTITTSEAAKHIGERETVCGTIADVHTAVSSRPHRAAIRRAESADRSVRSLVASEAP